MARSLHYRWSTDLVRGRVSGGHFALLHHKAQRVGTQDSLLSPTALAAFSLAGQTHAYT